MAPTAKDKELEMLGKLAPLNILSEKELKKLLQEVSVESLNRGEYLFHEGDTDPENVYLLSGKVALLKGETEIESLTGNTDAARFALAHLFPRQHAVRAKSRIEYVRINSHRLSKLVDNARINAHKAEKPESKEEDDWKSLLLQSRIFQLIPHANIQHVMNRMEEIVANKDEQMIYQGEKGDYFYLISKGHCSVSQKQANSQHSIEVAQLGPGDCFGEDALLSDKLRSSTVTMLTDGVLMRLSKDDFINLVKHPLATTINYSEASKITAAKGVWLDIRSPEEYLQGHMGGSINLPLNSLRIQLSSLAPERSYVIYCQDGRYSAVAAFLLLERGFDATILNGGVKSIPEKMLIRRDLSPQEKGAKIITLRPGDAAGITQHEQLVIQRDEADARAQTLDNQLLALRKEHGQREQKLLAQVVAFKQKTHQAEEHSITLDQQISELKSEKRVQEAELEVLLSTAQEQEQIELAQLQTLQKQLKHLQQQLTTVKKEKENALVQLEEQFKQSKLVEASSMICTPDLEEMDRDLQVMSKRQGAQSTGALQEKEKALQTVLNNLEQQTKSPMDALDREVVRQELEQLRNAIKERSQEMERALLEQRSLEDALEDRDAHLEQVKQQMERSKVKLESVTTKYKQTEDAYRHAEAMAERLKRQLKTDPSQRIMNVAILDDASKNSPIKMGLLGILMGGLICFSVLNVLLVLNGKSEIIFSLSGDTTVQEILSGWLISEEVKTKPAKPLDRKKSPPAI